MEVVVSEVKVVQLVAGNGGGIKYIVDDKGRVWYKDWGTGRWTQINLPEEPESNKQGDRYIA